MMYIRQANSSEQCSFVITDGTNVLKKLYDENIDVNEELTNFTQEYNTMTAQEKYDNLKANAATLDSLKKAKIDALNEQCNLAIIEKFTSTLNAVTYSFSYDQEAQANFNGTAAAFTRSYITSVTWTAYDSNGNTVRLTLNATDFDTVAKDALTHVNGNISKFRDTLVPNVNSATTASAVDAVTW